MLIMLHKPSFAADYVIQLLLQILTIKIAPYEKILFYYA